MLQKADSIYCECDLALLRRVLAERFGNEVATSVFTTWSKHFAEFLLQDGWRVPDRHEEYQDLLNLILTEVAVPASQPERQVIAQWLAFSCMGQNHLWEDLGLPERPALSRMIADTFPALFARNSGNMRWKKFFYKQLCEQAEVFVCRSPTCQSCSEYRECFMPESV